ncbi:MAG TPA: glycosyltransferase family 4 protein [Candidatus Woesebacteria bacterium]|nr:glycosyltransferase family 4 protein [Candidatus Woesebacteria bacterium]
MKIAFVSDAIYPYNKGGKEKRLIDITTRLVAQGHEVHVYCMKWWKEPELHKIERGVHLHAISPLYPLYHGEKRSIKQAILFGLSCLKLIKEDWDVIDVDHMPFYPVIFTKFVCMLKGKKMYATWHEVWGYEYWKKYIGWKAPIAYMVEQFSVFLPDHILSVTDNTSKRIKKYYLEKIIFQQFFPV